MPAASRQSKLVFLVTEDWFFASHFLPMARTGVAMGFDVAVATRFSRHRAAIEATGARTIDFDMERGSGAGLGASVRVLRRATALLARERPDIVHAIALRSVLFAGLARRFAGTGTLVQAVTGLGLIGADARLKNRIARAGFRWLIRGPLEMPGTQYLFENGEDARWLRLAPGAANVTLVAGAGVDPARYPAMPLPPGDGPLRIAIVARMLWSKGVDLAVEAATLARARGADLELTLVGAPDPANPRTIPAATLEAWGRRDGVAWTGPTADVPAVWRDHHVACLASRGGEGLPRSLLEAASCGRAIVTANVPGCSLLVRDGIDGLLVPPGDAAALADAFCRLARDRALVAAMARSAAARVRTGFTEADVAAAVRALYLRILGTTERP